MSNLVLLYEQAPTTWEKLYTSEFWVHALRMRSYSHRNARYPLLQVPLGILFGRYRPEMAPL